MVFTVFVVFTGAAVIATLALYARQSLLIAYVLLGVLVGPSVLGLVSDPDTARGMSHIGIIFLLFLLGLNLNPTELLNMVRKTTLVTLASSMMFALAGFLIALAFAFPRADAIVIGLAMQAVSLEAGFYLTGASMVVSGVVVYLWMEETHPHFGTHTPPAPDVDRKRVPTDD